MGQEAMLNESRALVPCWPRLSRCKSSESGRPCLTMRARVLRASGSESSRASGVGSRGPASERAGGAAGRKPVDLSWTGVIVSFSSFGLAGLSFVIAIVFLYDGAVGPARRRLSHRSILGNAGAGGHRDGGDRLRSDRPGGGPEAGCKAARRPGRFLTDSKVCVRVGRLAELVEHRLHSAGFSGSNPLAPTNLRS